jgi:hypothetical protein
MVERSSPGRGWKFFPHHFIQKLGPTQPPTQWITDAISLGVKGRGVKPTTHLYVVPKSRMRGAIPPLSQYALTVWCSVEALGQLYLLPY